jgi:DNA-directed RNA polymerase specialized sigma24 family protein
MASPGSVTHWIHQLKTGDPAAAQKLWESYFQRLVNLARGKLRHAPRRAADEEDAALSAFDSFCRGAEQGRFPQLADRDDLWQLLVLITARKATRQALRERRRKRGGGQVHNASALADGDAEGPAFADLIGREPDPGFAAQVSEECQRLLGLLETDELRAVALWKMEGHTTEEIAAKLGCAWVTVHRRLRLIRKRWGQEDRP